MDIVYSNEKKYKNMAKAIENTPFGGFNQVNLQEYSNKVNPTEQQSILILNPKDAWGFFNAIENGFISKPNGIIELYGEGDLKSPLVYHTDNMELNRKTLVQQHTLNPDSINPIVEALTFLQKNLGNKNLSPIVYTGNNKPQLSDTWFSNVLATYFKGNPAFEGFYNQIVEMDKKTEELENYFQNILKVDVTAIQSLTQSHEKKLNIGTIAENLGNVSGCMKEISNKINLNAIGASFLLNIKAGGIALDFQNTYSDVFAKFCGVSDIVSKNLFLWKKGKRNLKIYKRKFLIGSKKFREMKKTYKKTYKGMKKNLKKDDYNMQFEIREALTEHYLMLALLSEIIKKQISLLNNYIALKPGLVNINDSFHGDGANIGLFKEIENTIKTADPLMKMQNPVLKGPYFANTTKLTGPGGAVQQLTADLQQLNEILKWMSNNSEMIGDIIEEFQKIQEAVNKQKVGFFTKTSSIALMNNFVVTVNNLNMMGVQLVPARELKKTVKCFTFVWLDQLQDILKKATYKNKEDHEILNLWKTIKSFAEINSKALRIEKRNRILLFSSLTIVVAILAVGIDWSSFIGSFKAFENGWELENFQNFGISLWNNIKGIPNRFVDIYKGVFPA